MVGLGKPEQAGKQTATTNKAVAARISAMADIEYWQAHDTNSSLN
jgi:hypothetical protein